MKIDKIKNADRLSPADMKRYRALMLLQEKWVLMTVMVLLDGPKGFNELSRQAACVINNTTLSQRLDLLEEAGVVVRTVHSAIPPRTSYELTEAGRGLKKVLDAIGRWADEYMPDGLTTLRQSRADQDQSSRAERPGRASRH